jgi:hypothetical protein
LVAAPSERSGQFDVHGAALHLSQQYSAYLEAQALIPPFRLKNLIIDSSSGLLAAAYLNALAHLLRLF